MKLKAYDLFLSHKLRINPTGALKNLHLPLKGAGMSMSNKNNEVLCL